MAINLSKAEKEKAIFFIVVTVLIIVALIQFVTRPAIRKLGNLNRQVSEVRENLKKSESLIARKSQIENRFNSLQAKLEDFKLALPSRSDVPNILQNISRLAGESRVKILKIEPIKLERKSPLPISPQVKQPVVQPPPSIYTEVPIKVEAKGGYHALGEFANRIESAKNLMSISDLEIESNTDDMYRHNIRLLISVYLLQEEISHY